MVKKALLWVGLGIAGLAAVVVAPVAGAGLLGGLVLIAEGVADGSFAAAPPEVAPAAPRDAGASTTTRVTFPDGSSATVHLPSEEDVPWGSSPHDAAGAEAAARAWVDAYSQSFAATDPAPLRALSGSGCDYCARAVDSIEWVDTAGWRYSGTSVSVVSAEVVDPTPTRAAVHLEVEVARSAVESADERVEVAGGRATEDVELVWVGDHWRVVEVDGPALALDLTGAP